MSRPSIYEQHDKHFENVSAFVVLKDGEFVAKVAFKYPRDGAGRLYAYVHWLGLQMARGSAAGYGYDKRSAAVSDAARQIKGGEAPRNVQLNADHFVAALDNDDGRYWDNRLSDAGFTVIQAV